MIHILISMVTTIISSSVHPREYSPAFVTIGTLTGGETESQCTFSFLFLHE